MAPMADSVSVVPGGVVAEATTMMASVVAACASVAVSADGACRARRMPALRARLRNC